MVMLGGLMQKIHIRGCRVGNPVLLFLHGGPGVTNRHSVILGHAELAEHFTLVAWDQRGTGGSYFGALPETMTVAQFVSDAYVLALYLCKELKKRRIFVIGGSWGTELGIRLIRDHPDVCEAYVGYGQVVDGFLNEQLTYDFVLEKAKAAGDAKALRALAKIGPPVEGSYRPVYGGLMKHRALLAKYGGSNMAKKSLWQGTVKPILLSGEYTWRDKIGIARGSRYTLRAMWRDVVRYNYILDAAKLGVPVYIFQGRHDRNTPSELVTRYFEALKAPHKELIWFEHSAHSPLTEEKELFHRLLIEKLIQNKGVTAP
ncbi:MAG: alpha/beta hydrolase [Clostridia bacterium]|nr:alpha/beta hydrolase [Clostridia bacterium]